jgi:hypothetical protein
VCKLVGTLRLSSPPTHSTPQSGGTDLSEAKLVLYRRDVSRRPARCSDAWMLNGQSWYTSCEGGEEVLAWRTFDRLAIAVAISIPILVVEAQPLLGGLSDD